MLRIPCDGIGVEVPGGIKPKVELLLPVSLPLGEHIGVENVRLATNVAEELEVDLIVSRPLRA